MAKLIYVVIASIPIVGLIVGFLIGAVAHLFGFGFWPAALTAGGAASVFVAGQVFAGR